MAFEQVILSAGGVELHPVEIRIRASASEAARSFSAKLTPRDATQSGIAAFAAEVAAIGEALARGPACTITASGDPMLTGWIERYHPVLSSTAPSITIEGRSKSALLVDGAAIHATGEWKKTKAHAVISELAGHYGVTVSDRTVESARRAVFRVTLGESVHSAAARLARVDGQLMTGAADGSLILYRGTLGAHAGGLIEGVNLCEGAEAIHDWSKRAQKQRVRGQRASGWSTDDLEIDESEDDDTVERPVERIVVASEEIDPALALKRARWHRDQAAGEGLKMKAPRCIGWRDEAGRLFEPAWTIWAESPYLGVAQDMAIEAVEFEQTENGTIAALDLVDPRALGAKGAAKGKGGKSSKQWVMPK